MAIWLYVKWPHGSKSTQYGCLLKKHLKFNILVKELNRYDQVVKSYWLNASANIFPLYIWPFSFIS
jgi:hypothetical protein